MENSILVDMCGVEGKRHEFESSSRLKTYTSTLCAVGQ